MENYGYLERGTLIQVGTILKWKDGAVREITAFRGRPSVKSYGRDVYYFTVDAKSLSNDWEYDACYDKQDIDEMVENGELKVYNPS
jgi:hypothetical protein